MPTVCDAVEEGAVFARVQLGQVVVEVYEVVAGGVGALAAACSTAASDQGVGGYGEAAVAVVGAVDPAYVEVGGQALDFAEEVDGLEAALPQPVREGVRGRRRVGRRRQLVGRAVGRSGRCRLDRRARTRRCRSAGTPTAPRPPTASRAHRPGWSARQTCSTSSAQPTHATATPAGASCRRRNRRRDRSPASPERQSPSLATGTTENALAAARPAARHAHAVRREPPTDSTQPDPADRSRTAPRQTSAAAHTPTATGPD